MPDGSQFVRLAAPDLREPAPPREALLLHDGDFHDPTRLPGRALRMLAVTAALHGSPPRIRISVANDQCR